MLSAQPIIDTSTITTEEAPEDVAVPSEDKPAKGLPAAEAVDQQPSAQDKGDDSSLSNQLLAAMSKMKERSKSPPPVETSAAATTVETTQNDASEAPKGKCKKFVEYFLLCALPINHSPGELSAALAKRKPLQDSIAAAAGGSSDDNKKQQGEQKSDVPADDIATNTPIESTKPGEVSNASADKGSTAVVQNEAQPTSPEQDKEVILPKVVDKVLAVSTAALYGGGAS